MNCDVLVVGAGPAGSMAAKTTAERGINTILIERNKTIGYPVRCAEGINKFLFQDTGIKKDNSFIEQEINGTKVYFYNEIYKLNSEQWKGYTVDRTIFDKYLAKLAEKAGSKIFTDTKAVGLKKDNNRWIVKIKTKKQYYNSIEAKIVIGADGFECNLGKWAGIRTKWNENEVCKCYELLLDCPNLKESDKFHMAFGEEFPMGYAWIFPKRKKANVGVGTTKKVNTTKALDFFINKYPKVDNILGRNYSIIEKRGGGIPMSGPKNIDETVSDGIILAGDAAGMVDPITGEGISFSMLSGISAGEAAAIGIERKEWNKKVLSIYEEIWRNKEFLGGNPLGEEFYMLKNIKDIFYHIFTHKTVSTSTRESLISTLSLENEEDIIQSIDDLKRKFRIS